ncbi:MAG: ABC-ATPase domain-containing protein [Spirulinaceae cyanobacterium SM2_1_0]|nr:ABC-ATPase domain-containing protein [Spirulinaceae cyanobacterium SM2_1_0]
MQTAHELAATLHALDGKSYGAYRAIAHQCYHYPQFTLQVERVQSDPFAAPSAVRVELPPDSAALPASLHRPSLRAVAAADFLTRAFSRVARQLSVDLGSGNSGMIVIAPVSQVILDRTAVQIDLDGTVIARFTVGLPAQGRRILGRQAAPLLTEVLPRIVTASLCYPALDAAALRAQVELVEDAEALRQGLHERGLVAFVANGSILPRQSGADDRPLSTGAVPLRSPPSLEVTLPCPHRGTVTGLGIPQGVTLIVGGGYHGKSTLLRVLEQGIYNHIPGDGRELAVSDRQAVKICAEDGRSIAGVNITPFINHLPRRQSTANFSTANASGSTSQAANLCEALEAGARVLLLDEDTSATNFMGRDRRMQALIPPPQEPISPFIDKVRQLYVERSVSTVLVAGSNGDYFDVADTAIALNDYQLHDVTAAMRAIAQRYPSQRQPEGGTSFGELSARYPQPQSLETRRGRRAVWVKVRSTDQLEFGENRIDLSAVVQLVESNQLRAIAAALIYVRQHDLDGQQPLHTVLQCLQADLQQFGWSALGEPLPGDWAEFRSLEFAAVLNRLRSLQA